MFGGAISAGQGESALPPPVQPYIRAGSQDDVALNGSGQAPNSHSMCFLQGSVRPTNKSLLPPPNCSGYITVTKTVVFERWQTGDQGLMVYHAADAQVSLLDSQYGYEL